MVRGRCEPLNGSLAAAALARVPGLSDGLPDLRLPPHDRQVSFPIASTELLSPLVDRALRGAVDEALAEMREVPADELERKLQDDPLTRALVRLLEEGLGLSVGAGALVALEYVRSCSSRMAAPTPLLVEGVRRLGDLGAAARTVALRSVAAAMSARLAVASAALARAGVRVPALVTMLTDAPLVWVLPYGAPLPIDLELAVGALGPPDDEVLLQAASVAFDLVVGGVLARVGDRTIGPRDAPLSLRFCLPALKASGAGAALARLRGEPDAWTVVLPQLSSWVDAAALVRAGLSAAAVDSLLRVDVAVALASKIAEAARAWQAAQVVACVLAAIAPTGEPSVARQLLLPRGQAVSATVVAVSTGMVAAAMGEQIALSPEIRSLFAAWNEGAGSAAVSSLDGPIAWFVFTDPIAAVRFAATVGERSAAGLPPPAVSVATGPITGGSDGAVLRLAGGVVQEALSLLAHLPRPRRPPSLLGHKELVLDRGRLAGHAAALDGATVDLLCGAALTPIPGLVPPGVHAAWEFDGGVLVVVPIPALPGASGAVQLTFAEWTALASGASAVPSAAGPAPLRSRAKAVPVVVATPDAAPAPPGNPFDDEAGPTSILGPAPAPHRHPSSANPFDDAFGIPVGDDKAPPPSAPPPAYFEGMAGFDITNESPAASGPDAGFPLPAFSGEPSPVTAAVLDPKPTRVPVVDFDVLLAGYACYIERDRVVFGRPYGTRLVDMHAFDTDGNLDRAYLAFMQAKILEGFAPQAELSGELARTVTVMPLDLERLRAAWRALT